MAKTQIEVIENFEEKTFIIVKTVGETITKYKTNPIISHENYEFEDMTYYTQEDWRNYLRTSQNYYVI